MQMFFVAELRKLFAYSLKKKVGFFSFYLDMHLFILHKHKYKQIHI